MPENAGDIVLPVRLSTEEAEAVWRQLESRAHVSGQRTGQAFQEGAAGVEKAGGSFLTLRERLLAYRREETQQTRATRFFAQEFSQLIPVGADVAGTLSRLALVLGAGGVFGIAIEGAKWAVESFVASQRRATV